MKRLADGIDAGSEGENCAIRRVVIAGAKSKPTLPFVVRICRSSSLTSRRAGDPSTAEHSSLQIVFMFLIAASLPSRIRSRAISRARAPR
ncbi:MAG TPA: hypothetical protein VHE11_11625 [Steroidobacteraceae bacterium]|nr:hypothetical protein [Steroidobacteraceae bacterium]